MKSIINKLKFNLRTDIYPDDVFLVSYPKSGNTWLKFIFANYIKQSQIDFNEVHGIIPEYETQKKELSILQFRPRIIKSHSRYNKKFPKVIYIVRDGRDVAVSYFYYLKKTQVISSELNFSNFLDNYLIGKVPHGKWGDHVESWLRKSLRSDKILVVFYEDLLKDTYQEAERLIDFSGLNIDNHHLSNAISNSSFQQLTTLEEKSKYTDKYLSTTDHNIPFVRKGEAGDYLNYFTEEENTLFLHSYRKVYDLIDKYRNRINGQFSINK